MSFEAFKRIADILKEHHVLIRGMYTTGEPLLDPTLPEKFMYARKIGVLAPLVSLSTNVSLLTKEKFDRILMATDNIALSFFNVRDKYEQLTGLSWETSYRNALDFIAYRDVVKPNYRIFISCNRVSIADLNDVKQAFKGKRVEWAIDAELRLTQKLLTGYVDRAILHPMFRCDGHEGVLMIKWNGDIEACSFDFHMETCYANIFQQSWSEIVERFKMGWKKPFHLCARCDYYHLYWRVKRNKFKYVTDYSWQKPFLAEGEKYQR